MFRNFHRLEAYYWLARLGSFRAAAERLGVTQPTISIRIKDFEAEAGAPLFIRGGRSVRLTDQGRALFDQVERVIALVNDLDGQVHHGDPLRGTLRIGVPDSFALCCLPSFLACVERDHPELSLAITVDNSRTLAQRLDDQLLDIAILVRPEAGASFRMKPLGLQALAWVASPQMGFSDEPVEPVALSRHQIFTNPPPSPTLTILMDWFSVHGLVPARVNTCNSFAAITAITAETRCISVLPSCVAMSYLSVGTLTKLNVDPPLPKQEMVVAHTKMTVSRTAGPITEIIREAIMGSAFVEDDKLENFLFANQAAD